MQKGANTGRRRPEERERQYVNRSIQGENCRGGSGLNDV